MKKILRRYFLAIVFWAAAWADIKIKKSGLNEKGPSFTLGPSVLVRLAGIEPTTPWFVAKYSIQLSYSRIKTDIMPWKSKTT